MLCGEAYLKTQCQKMWDRRGGMGSILMFQCHLHISESSTIGTLSCVTSTDSNDVSMLLEETSEIQRTWVDAIQSCIQPRHTCRANSASLRRGLSVLLFDNFWALANPEWQNVHGCNVGNRGYIERRAGRVQTNCRELNFLYKYVKIP